MTEKRKVMDLIPADYNPRKISESNRIDLMDSIKQFSEVEPVIINKDNKLIGGHQRVSIYADLGFDEIDVRVPDRQLTMEEEMRLNLRLNKNGGDWDMEKLAELDKNLLLEVGFADKELRALYNTESQPEDDEIPEKPAVAKTKLGDLYQLGQHRLLCGDSIKREDVERLMGGAKSEMIFTDPPYNIDYGSSKNPKHKVRTIANDKQSPAEWEEFCKKLFANFQEFNTGDIYMWGASGPEGMRMRLWLTELGCHWSATIIWKKHQLVLSPANYQRIYEPCFYGWFDKSSWQGDRKQVEVWEIDRPINSKLHPTMKPVELCSVGILNSSKLKGIVLDLFLGSGSTLIACEKNGRNCYGMEMDPIYCDVIIERWEKLTGQKAQKIV